MGGRGQEPPRYTAAILVGAVCGLAWAASLRSYMAEISPISQVAWWGTFFGILLPGVVTGALLGLAWARGRAGRTQRIGLFALAPLSFAVAPMLLPGALIALLTQGLGGGALAVSLAAIAGGYALSGGGMLWARIACGVLAAAMTIALAVTPGFIGGSRLGLTEPRGIWVGLLAGSLMVVLILATSIPFRLRARRRRDQVASAAVSGESSETDAAPAANPSA